MPTSLHIPKALLSAVDRRARKLKMSRNRFVVKTLERALASDAAWSPGFFDTLREVDPDVAALADEMVGAMLERRGARIEDFDVAIAAHALAAGATLVTANVGHMTRVPGLTVDDWAR